MEETKGTILWGAIKGNRIDVFTASHDKAMQMGHKVSQVWLIGKV